MRTSMGGKPFGKPIRVGAMPKAPDGKLLPVGLPKADVAMSKRHRLESIRFHKQHANEHMDKAKEHRAALKDGAYAGVRGDKPRASLSDMISRRQSARDGSRDAPLSRVLVAMTR